MTKCKKIKNIE